MPQCIQEMQEEDSIKMRVLFYLIVFGATLRTNELFL